MPAASGLAQLRDYQMRGIMWLHEHLARHKAVLLCDDPGLGKTVQTLALACQFDTNRVLVVCPAGARRVWAQEIARWLPSWSPRVFLVEPGTTGPKAVEIRLADPSPLVLVVSYDELSKTETRLTGLLERAAWDLLVLDEAHYLKNPSNRTKALYGDGGAASGIQHSARHVILLTGTPTPNHAGELYQHMRTFWPQTLRLPRLDRAMNQPEFEERFTRYKDTVFGRQVVGSKNQALLRARLDDMVLRRRKDQVLPELPPLVLQDIPLDVPGPDVPPSITRELAARLNWAARNSDDAALLKALREPDPAIARVRRELGELKVEPTVRWVQERMNSTSKILLFAWHLSVIEHLRRALTEFDPVVITGETTPGGRTNAVELFQRRPGVRVFIGQVLAAGTAITLTAANEVAIVEPSWVPGDNVQAICRAHRLGQRDSVLASFLYLPGTLDQRIMQTFRRKAAEISELQGDDAYASADTRDFRRGTQRPGPRQPADHAAQSA